MSFNVQNVESIELKVLSKTPAKGGKLKRRTPGSIRNTAVAVRNEIEMSSGFEDMANGENINTFKQFRTSIRESVNRIILALWFMVISQGAEFSMRVRRTVNRIRSWLCIRPIRPSNENLNNIEQRNAIEPMGPETPELIRNTVIVFRNHHSSPRLEMLPEFEDMPNLNALEPNIVIQMKTPETNRNTVVVFRNNHSSPRVENLPEFEDIVINENPNVFRRFLNAIGRWCMDGWVWFLAIHEILIEALVVTPLYELRHHAFRPYHEQLGTPPFTRVFFSNGIRMHAPPREEMPDENLNAFGRFRWHVRQVLDRLNNPNPSPNPYLVTFFFLQLFCNVLGYLLTYWYYVYILPFLAPYLRPLLRPCSEYLASWWYWLSEILEP